MERVEVKPEVKMEESFEDEEDRVGSNDVDYMVSVVEPHSIDVPSTLCTIRLRTLVRLFQAGSLCFSRLHFSRTSFKFYVIQIQGSELMERSVLYLTFWHIKVSTYKQKKI